MKGDVLIAADFHLSSEDPRGVESFVSFIKERVSGAAAFYILGDLFDLWIGPSQLDESVLRPAFDALRTLSENGTQVTLLHGNRDFLLGRAESEALGAEIPGESVERLIQGKRLFLTHGDIFCPQDKSYQRLKKILRTPLVRRMVRIIPDLLLHFCAGWLRTRSKKALSRKDRKIMSIHVPLVETLACEMGIDAVFCGHFHQPQDRILEGGGRLIVLSEWRDQKGTYIVCREGCFEVCQAKTSIETQ